MMRKATVQLVYQTVYLVLALFGFLNSVGYFAAEFNADFYVFYTNLSNYICMGVMAVTWVDTFRRADGHRDGACRVAPVFTFFSVILILVTLLVYNFLLAGEHTVVSYFTTQANLLMHAVLPLMFIAHWLFFCEHPTLRWFHPLLGMLMPLGYVLFILVRAAWLPHATVRYPYFFLDIDTLGMGGFLTWIAVLLAVFVAIGYLLYAVDRVCGKGKKG